MTERTQSREAWEGDKEHAGFSPALTWGGTDGRGLTLSSTMAYLSTRSQPPLARPHVPPDCSPSTLSTCGKSAWFSPRRVLILWIRGGAHLPSPSWGSLSAYSHPRNPPRAQRCTCTSRGTQVACVLTAHHWLLCGLPVLPTCASCFRTQGCSGYPGFCPPAPQAVRAVFLLQTFGTRPARSGSRVCTPPTTTRPTPASWYETSRASLA